tara:strand:- start:26056 stop:26988 length:933 start_codon:yes stop_codon:yes gene_type:complete
MTLLSISPDYRPLGKSGLTVFPIAYGMWRFAGTSPKEAKAKIEAALDVGVTLFDTADVYGLDNNQPFGAAEKLLGEALRLSPTLRDRMVVATKGGIIPGTPYNSSKAYLKSACEASLQRMGLDVIDLYQIHRPDMLAHPHDVAEALIELKKEGKIRHVGVSNMSVSATRALAAHLPFPIATHQPEFSAWHTAPLNDGVLDLCMEQQIGVLAWSPLAGGKLGLGRDAAMRLPHGTRLMALLDGLDEIAVRENTTRENVAMAFVLAHPARIIPIAGTQRLDRISQLKDVFKVKLTRTDWYGLLQTSTGERLP